MELFFLFLIAFATVGYITELSEEQKAKIKKEVNEVVMKFLDAKTLSYETEVEIRADKEGFLHAGDGKIQFADYRSFHDYVKKSFEDIKQFQDLEILSLHTYVLAEDAAVSTFEMKSHYITAKGDIVPHNACWTLVFKKFDGKWKVIQENGTHTR